MKLFIAAVLLFSVQAVLAKDLTLSQAKAEYTVKHLFKTVKGVSSDLKGKMVCENQTCEFLVAIGSKSFVSSDSNRDLNLQTIIEVTKYPLIIVKGSLSQADLGKDQFDLPAKVSFHGIEKSYTLKIKRSEPFSGQLTLLLEDHKVERPSLLMAKIDNEVPVQFTFDWKE